VSPDERQVAFVTNGQTRRRLAVMPLHREAEVRILWTGEGRFDQAFSPAWSPDGARIAFALRARDGTSRIAVAGLRGGLSYITPAGERASNPAWSPDGASIAYTRHLEGDAEVWLVRAEGGAPKALARSPAADWLPRWVPRR
ncbi:MAG TPA: hypothetical protein VNP72_04015, partial [Longimicrobium sp.]|nr:hypothetical protein [Longimicrobium sp.]